MILAVSKKDTISSSSLNEQVIVASFRKSIKSPSFVYPTIFIITSFLHSKSSDLAFGTQYKRIVHQMPRSLYDL